MTSMHFAIEWNGEKKLIAVIYVYVIDITHVAASASDVANVLQTINSCFQRQH